MLLTEYNEKQHIEIEKGISFTQGITKGITEGDMKAY